MEPPSASQDGHSAGVTTDATQTTPPVVTHKKSLSGGGLLSKFSFARNPLGHQPKQDSPPAPATYQKENQQPVVAAPIVAPTPRQPISIANALQQQKTRRRRGSLRKVALLGRGAQRERREARSASLSIDVKQAESYGVGMMSNKQEDENSSGYGLGITDITPRPSMDGYASRSAPAVAAASLLASSSARSSNPKVEIDEPTPTSPTISYTTTDDEDILHIKRNRDGPELASLSSGSESFYHDVEPMPRRRTINRARSPLADVAAVVPVEEDYDYSETEWWGWVILVVTWIVFVVGMGSVFGVWGWAWDVGATPYAPPELEDDPTLPINGYYPALLILTCVMAWVWALSSWVGMKYFRHAKISGD